MVVLKQKCHDTSFLPSLRCTAWAIIRKKVQFRIVTLFETTIHLLKYFSNFNLLPTIFLGDEKKPQPYRHILRQNLMMRTCWPKSSSLLDVYQRILYQTSSRNFLLDVQQQKNSYLQGVFQKVYISTRRLVAEKQLYQTSSRISIGCLVELLLDVQQTR